MVNNNKLETLYKQREDLCYNMTEANGEKLFKLEEKLEQLENLIAELEEERNYVMDFWQKYAD